MSAGTRIPPFHPNPVIILDTGNRPHHLGDLLDGFDTRTGQLWVAPEVAQSWELPAELPALKPGTGYPHPFIEDAMPAWVVGVSPPGLAPWLRCWVNMARFPDRRGYDLAFPGWDKSSPFHGLPGADLEASVRAFFMAVEIPWHRSGALTSDRLLRRLHWRSDSVPAPGSELGAGGELPSHMPAGEVGRRAAPYHWWREPDELNANEKRARWCHALDANGMFLSAASSLPLSSGPPIYAGYGDISERIAGLWWLDPERLPEEPENLPDPFAHVRAVGGWVTSPTAALAVDMGYQSGTWHFAFSGGGRYLEPWYRALRDARKMLTGPELAAVKATYAEGIGRLGSPNRSNPEDPWYQPYWRHAVMAEARCRLFRRLRNLDAQPVAVDVDCCWYLSSSPQPSNVGLPIGTGLGQFKHAGTIRGDIARTILAEGQRSVGKLAGMIR
jgi:hypothetical protein